jgi:hypothetical protein
MRRKKRVFAPHKCLLYLDMIVIVYAEVFLLLPLPLPVD